MKQVRVGEELVGKTIAAVYFDDILMVKFTDDTFALVRPENGYEGDIGLRDKDEYKIGAEYDEDRAAVAIGVVAQSEVDAYHERHNRARAEAAERRERMVFEELKKKYGS